MATGANLGRDPLPKPKTFLDIQAMGGLNPYERKIIEEGIAAFTDATWPMVARHIVARNAHHGFLPATIARLALLAAVNPPRTAMPEDPVVPPEPGLAVRGR